MAEFKHPFKEKSWNTDLAIRFEKEKLYVSKHFLGLVYPVFETMFKGQFKEKVQDEIELPGKKIQEFTEFLWCIYPNILKPVTATNVYQMIPLAHEYQTDEILRKCEAILLEKSNRDKGVVIFKHLAMAIVYHCEALERKCMELAPTQQSANIKRWSSEQCVPNDKVQIILFKALELRESSILSLEKERNELQCNLKKDSELLELISKQSEKRSPFSARGVRGSL